MEQRVNIKFCFKAGKRAAETFLLIKHAYGDNALSCTLVFEWYARFQDGHENLEDDNSSSKHLTQSKHFVN